MATGQKVQVEMMHRLSTLVSDVGDHPPTIGIVAAKLLSYLGHVDPRRFRGLIVDIEVIQRSDVTLGDDENVGGRHRSDVAEGDGMFRLHHLVRRDFSHDQSAKQTV